MHRSLSTLFLVACLLVAGESRAGAWLQARGASYLKLTAVYSATDDRLDGHGNREPAEPFGGTYRERKLFWYGEYGVLHWLTLVGSFGWGEQEIVDALVPDYGTRSTGDLKIAGRWGLWRDPKIPISLETAFSIPTYPASSCLQPRSEAAATVFSESSSSGGSGPLVTPLPPVRPERSRSRNGICASGPKQPGVSPDPGGSGWPGRP
jgi:hypothetical protein